MNLSNEVMKIIEKIDGDYEHLTLEEFYNLLDELISELRFRLESVEEALNS